MAASVPTPPKPEWQDADETSISCVWDPDPDCSYRLEYKEYPDAWEDCMSIEIPKGQGKADAGDGKDSGNTIEELNPTSTYCLRLVAIKDGVESEPGEELIVDTQAAKCTPDADEAKGKCVIS
mmetsp:Transcript_13564/g.23768  ORF Transcript_13564/g.23768 Transcript_13564/m.23768 type:complete len:123 (-) Transcript_13564:217-585(-)